MIEPAKFLLFIGVSWALILAPGPDMLYVITRGIAHGRRAGILSAIGVHTHQIWLLYLGYGVIGGCGLGLGYVSPVSTLIKWFPDRPGMATGIANTILDKRSEIERIFGELDEASAI